MVDDNVMEEMINWLIAWKSFNIVNYFDFSLFLEADSDSNASGSTSIQPVKQSMQMYLFINVNIQMCLSEYNTI